MNIIKFYIFYVFIEFISSEFNIIEDKMSCENSFLDNKEVYIISKSNPTIILFNKYSYDFNTVPNIYYGDNEPLYKNCKIDKDKKYEIICSFSEDEIEKNFFLYNTSIVIFEVIPGCSNKIYSKFYIKFDYTIKNCKEFSDEKHKCVKCKNKKYKVSINGEKCVYSSYFYYICIGVPIINVFSFILCVVIVMNQERKDDKFVAVGVIGFLVVLFDILSFIPLY